MAVDGHLNFDTLINTKGFQSGIKDIGKALSGIKGSVMNLAGAFGIAFGTAALVNFSKSAKELYNVQLEGETKLETVLGKHLDATKEQIQATKDYASALQEVGVIGDEVQLAGLQELSTYIGNPDSLKKMNVVLNDMLAQQYGLNATAESAVTISTMLGKVLSGQTSALSRYGYTFDEAQEKLLKFGTEEQRVATLADVVLNSVGGMNEALAQTPAGRMKQLSNTMGDIKEQFGAAITQIEVLLLPALKQVASVLQSIAEKANEVSQALAEVFGTKSNKKVSTTGTGEINGDVSESTADLSDEAKEAADSYEDMAKAAKDANKANKEDLASFDKLNVKAKDTADITSDSAEEKAKEAAESAADEAAEAINPAITFDVDADTTKAESTLTKLIRSLKNSFQKVADSITPIFNNISDTISNIAENFKSAWESGTGLQIVQKISNIFGTILKHIKNISKSTSDWSKDLDFDPLLTSLSGLLDPIQKIVDLAGTWTESVWDKIFLPLSKWTVEDGVPAALNAFKGFLSLAEKVGEKVGNVLSVIWDEFFSKLISWAADGVVKFLNVFGQLLDDVANNDKAVNTLVVVAEVIGTIIVAITTVNAVLAALPAMIGAIPGLIAALTNPVTWIIIALVAIGVVIVELVTYWDTLKEAWIEGVDTIKNAVKNRFTKIVNWFKNGWSQFANWWTNKVLDVIGKIKGFFKDLVNNGILARINGLISGVANGINYLIDMLNSLSFDVPDWVPGIGGSTLGFDIQHVTPPQIPYLAQGTVVPANYGEFAAILGDNRKEPEIVSPYSTIKQAMIDALKEANIGGNTGDIVIKIDEREIFRAMQKQSNNYSRTHGGRPAFG